ncbi:MAG: hypothetical protein LBU60_03565 [Clostridiales bacterium]|jgi:flavorubredoxin|nr:hypothetical protein [Clostridiales bacterium]
MNVEIRYYSKGGNTRAAAETIAKLFAVTAQPIDIALQTHADILFVGSGCYEGKPSTETIEFLQNINASNVSLLVAFGTAGGMKKAVKQIANTAKSNGINVYKKLLVLRMFKSGAKQLEKNNGQLSDRKQNKIKKFVEKLKQDKIG